MVRKVRMPQQAMVVGDKHHGHSVLFFFFQAEDGIRDYKVTGVQTCALPISKEVPPAHLGDTVGLFLIAWGIFTTYMWIASLRTTAAISLVFILLAATFIKIGRASCRERV